MNSSDDLQPVHFLLIQLGLTFVSLLATEAGAIIWNILIGASLFSFLTTLLFVVRTKGGGLWPKIKPWQQLRVIR